MDPLYLVLVLRSDPISGRMTEKERKLSHGIVQAPYITYNVHRPNLLGTPAHIPSRISTWNHFS